MQHVSANKWPEAAQFKKTTHCFPNKYFFLHTYGCLGSAAPKISESFLFHACHARHARHAHFLF